MEETNVRLISDLSLVAYLLILGHQNLKPPFKEGNRIVFQFPKSQQVEHDIETYFEGKALVNPLVFEERVKRLRIWVRDLRMEVSNE